MKNWVFLVGMFMLSVSIIILVSSYLRPSSKREAIWAVHLVL